jgi:very-short-patch-repair endonuclease
MQDFLTRGELLMTGFTSRGITRAVRSGALVRARRDHYLAPDAPADVIRAVRIGGRLTCLTLLRMWEVFVQSPGGLHVHVPPNAARLRSPHDRRRRLGPRGRRQAHVHWTPLLREVGQSSVVSAVDALLHAVICQSPRAAVATLDSAVRRGIVDHDDLDEIFARLPHRYRPLRGLMDARVESGPETLVGLMLRGLGCSYVPQVVFGGIGRVDFVVDGWLVIECDSEAHHGTWAQHERDRRRDAQLAALGYHSLRLTARVIMDEPELALAAIRGLLDGRVRTH